MSNCLPSHTTSTVHDRSGYTFLRHYQFPKKKFDMGKLWKAAHAIVEKGGVPGSERPLCILELSRKVFPGTNGQESRKDRREEDMIRRVAAALAAVGSKSPLAIYENSFVKSYLELLDPSHSPPLPP